MAKQIRRGTKVGDVVVLHGEPTQMRKIVCPACHIYATTQKVGGKEVATCSRCGRRFTSRKI